jgi:hypothetical protein
MQGKSGSRHAGTPAIGDRDHAVMRSLAFAVPVHSYQFADCKIVY